MRRMPSGITVVWLVRSPTTRCALFVPGSRRTGTRRSLASRSSSSNESAGRPFCWASFGEEPDDLVRIGRAEPGGGEDLLLVGAQRTNGLITGTVLAHEQLMTGLFDVENGVAMTVGIAVGDSDLEHDLLQTDSARHRCEPVGEVKRLVAASASRARGRRGPAGSPAGGHAARIERVRNASLRTPAVRSVRGEGMCAHRSPGPRRASARGPRRPRRAGGPWGSCGRPRRTRRRLRATAAVRVRSSRAATTRAARRASGAGSGRAGSPRTNRRRSRRA